MNCALLRRVSTRSADLFVRGEVPTPLGGRSWVSQEGLSSAPAEEMVQAPRFERGTSGSTIRRSNQLSYACTFSQRDKVLRGGRKLDFAAANCKPLLYGNCPFPPAAAPKPALSCSTCRKSRLPEG